jgi:hypothetical protein
MGPDTCGRIETLLNGGKPMKNEPKQTKIPAMMVATMNGHVLNWPAYLIDPEKVDEFKERFDGIAPGTSWFPLTTVIDLRGPLRNTKFLTTES